MNDHEIGALYNELHGYLFTLIQSRIYEGCPQDYIYDCLDEVFLIALGKKKDKKFRQNPKGWLIITAKHVVDNFNRKHKNRLRFHDPEVEVENLSVPQDFIEHLALKMALEDHLFDKIKTELSEEERVLYIMRFEENKTTKEIAQELGIRHGTISTRVNRMKNHVESLITKYVGS